MFQTNRNILWSASVYQWEFAEDHITVKILAWADWKLRIPTAWYWTNWQRWCYYNRFINVDWWDYTQYVWTWSTSNNIVIAEWLEPNSEHLVDLRIFDVEDQYWRARAFWWSWSWIADRLTELVVDSCYLWFADSAESTWNYFRYRQYEWCTNLKNAYNEYIPATCRDTGTNFRCYQYNWCTSLITAWVESCPNSIEEIKWWFREYQYANCRSLQQPAAEVMPNTVTVIWDHFRWWQYQNCVSITNWAQEVLPPNLENIYSYFRCNQYEWCTNLTTVSDEVMPDTVTYIATYFRLCQYRNCPNLTATAKEAMSTSIQTQEYHFRHQQYEWDTWITLVKWIQAPPASLYHHYCRYLQFNWALNSSEPATVYVYWPIVESEQWWNFWFSDAKIAAVYVPCELLEAYKNSNDNMRRYINDNKFHCF